MSGCGRGQGMTDYLEELLDQLEEEEAGTAARWPEGQAPAWAGVPGCAALWEEELTGHSPCVRQGGRQSGGRRWEYWTLQGKWRPPFFPGRQRYGQLPGGPVPPGNGGTRCLCTRDSRRLRPGLCRSWTHWRRLPGRAGAPRPAGAGGALGTDGGTGAGRSRGGPASARVETGELTTPGRAGRRPWGWSERGEDPAAAVDRAFQRDSRRYDQGFALY